MKIYIVQEEYDGIIESPRLFLTEKEADEVYITCINENENKNFITIEEALNFMEKYEGIDWNIRYWEKEIEH